MDITYGDQILPVYRMRVHRFRREIMYVFHCLQWFCTTGGVEQRTATAPWIQYTPCLGLEMVAFILARLWIGCLLAAPSSQEISWPVCMIRMLHCPPAVWFASTVGCGSGAHCPLLKHSPSAARGTFRVCSLREK
jgi:hypothetical protein